METRTPARLTLTMYSNAVNDTRNIQTDIPQTNVRVDYVYAHGCHISDRRIPLLRRECVQRGVRFVAREYAPRKYSEDRELIERLPALHAHAGVAYKKTFYPDTNPVATIEDVVKDSKTYLSPREEWIRKIHSAAAVVWTFRQRHKHENVVSNRIRR